MRRDSIFYSFFQRSPTFIFDLLPNPPANVADYRFDSVSVKEAKFEMDGVFLPPDNSPGTVYFCEVQMQKIKTLYERIFAEGFLYFYRNRSRFTDWQVIVIYPSRSIEQDTVHPFRTLLSSEQVPLIYLDELGSVEQLPLWVALMVLTTVQTREVVESARTLMARARKEKTPNESRAIIEMVATIIGYKFEQLSFQEIQAMLDMPIKESVVFQEGRKRGQFGLIKRQLTKQFGELPEDVCTSISELSAPELESLGEAILDFSTLADLQVWLTANV
ncbi:MAG: DUF2887 domain-containing protein [Cyanobacteria bacterium J06597_16]